MPKLGIGGPVGSGKTRLIEVLVPVLKKKGIRCGIISNDVISKEDAERMQRILATESKLMPEGLDYWGSYRRVSLIQPCEKTLQ